MSHSPLFSQEVLDLLAVMNGDGGHYCEEHGVAAACKRAEERYYEAVGKASVGAVPREDFDKMSADLTRAKNLLVRLWDCHPSTRPMIEGATGNWFVWGVNREAAAAPGAASNAQDDHPVGEMTLGGSYMGKSFTGFMSFDLPVGTKLYRRPPNREGFPYSKTELSQSIEQGEGRMRVVINSIKHWLP